MRSKGEGSVWQRSDGTWEGRISLGHRIEDGSRRRIRRSVYGATKAEVLRELARIQFEAGNGYPDAARLTVAEYLERWLTDTVEKEGRYNTITTYRRIVRLHIVPHIGSTFLASLRPTSMDGLQAALEAAKTPAHTANYACRLFRTAVRAAARKEVLPRNPFADVRLKQVVRPKRQTWTMDHAQAFFAAAKARNDRLEAFYILAVATGLRHSELLGLKWSDVDYTAGTLRVERRLQEFREKGGTRFEIQDVKTEASKATIAVPPEALSALKAHRVARFAEGIRSEFIFVTTKAGHYIQDNVRSASKRTMALAGVPAIRIHDLRHTCATLLLQAGLSLKHIQALLRHKQYTTTANIYAHVTQQMESATAQAMETLLTTKANKGGGK